MTTRDLADGESTEVQGSGAKPYVLKNSGGVYSCSCPAWRNQSNAIEQRTCKHIRKLRGDAQEEARIGGSLPQRPVRAKADGTEAVGAPVLLAESWDNARDLSGWWMSEKLDGVRAYWDGTQFLSRQGNMYHAPDWFTAGLPAEPLDGELWIARKAFQRTVGIVRRQDKTELWQEVQFLVFDAPAQALGFEARMQYLALQLPAWQLKYASLLAQTLCNSMEHLQAELARIEALGGEGLMLREPGSRYAVGRSSTLYKVKSFLDDEATVVGYEAGRGKHVGKVGALNVQLANGKLFSVGTGLSDKQRASPPAIGALIKFRYQELTDGGIPRFPSFVGVHENSVVTGVSALPNAKQATPTTVATPTAARLFECTEDGAAKFWNVLCEDVNVTTRWGKIGTVGQVKTKAHATVEKALAEVEKLVLEKTAKGYIELV
jgi:DNA ligase 1